MNNKKINALVNFLEVEKIEIKPSTYNTNVYEVGNAEYMVLTDTEATKEAIMYIKESMWAFNRSFIMSHLNSRYAKMNEELINELIDSAQNSCEDGNDFISSIVRKKDFITEAIACDGRGHFLSSYDGNEYEQGNYYIYRTN